MGELIAFANSHPILASLVVAFLVAVIAYEARLKGRGLVQVSAATAVQLINKGAMIIDVRPEEAYAEGHIVNSKHFPLAEIESNPDAIKKKKDKVLLTVCDSGPVAKRAADALRKSGFESAFSLQGGLAAWRTENLPLVK
ncbi:MAG: rhodanese-like domain-containing protein [Gammaproteobacteria bacterium]|jgi:rhodanese-related sulfurtransferase